MKAIIYERYGTPDVLTLTEVTTPVPGDNEIQIKIKATAVNSADYRLRKADPFMVRLVFGLFRPRIRILGGIFSGEVEKCGKDVTLFREGDQVFGSTEMKMGTYAQYTCITETGAIAKKPKNLNHEEAAAIPFGAHTALHFFRKADLRPGQKILVYGASGAVGSAAVQLAIHYGAEVVAVCSSANTEMMKSLGVEKIIDYTRDSLDLFGRDYDVIFETVNKTSAIKLSKLLKNKGRLILGAAMFRQMLQGLWLSLFSGKKVLMGTATVNAADMDYLKELAENDKLKPVIDRTYPLEQMAEAHRYADTGHKKGNVVISVG
jgi:NADPH:quinone reductase-like Zn-dependent oxidoreductase